MSGGALVAWTPDGHNVVTASDNDAVRVWDVQTGTVLRTVVRSGGGVALSPRGNFVAVSRPNGETELWDVATGRLSQTQRLEDDNGKPLRLLAVSPDGQFVVTPGATIAVLPLLSVWRFPATEASAEFSFFIPFPVHLAAFSHDSRLLFAAGRVELFPVTGLYFGTALLWNLDADTQLPAQQFIDDLLITVESAAFSPDGTRLALSTSRSVSPWNQTVRVWDLSTRQWTLTLNDTLGPVEFSPDGKWLRTGYDDSHTRLWDAQSGRLLCEFAVAGGSLAVSPDRSQALIGSYGFATLWDLRDLRGDLRIGVEEGKTAVLWDAGALESALQVNGPWTSVEGATSPYTVLDVPGSRFFRVRLSE